MVPESRMVSPGFGKYARADRVFAVEPRRGDDRSVGWRTRGWVEGIGDPVIASRTERTTLHDIGQQDLADVPLVDEVLGLAALLAAAAYAGRVELGDLGCRARRLLAE
ncbi:MAG: hypothetical protein H0V32_02625 [Nocardioidaceae bacterium]|nr:hypothetical protein [Nocardioidaceae bacterium]MBA3991178.1 hypothetical protein [Propionibacteriales bacterium]MDQ3325546.1 hypothetical protein [Actinomycetota bacterium]